MHASSVNYKYTVTAYSRYAYEACEGNLSRITGFDCEDGCDTLTEAKTRAKYLVSEEARISNEASERAVYAQVCNAKGECLWDILKLTPEASAAPLPSESKNQPAQAPQANTFDVNEISQRIAEKIMRQFADDKAVNVETLASLIGDELARFKIASSPDLPHSSAIKMA